MRQSKLLGIGAGIAALVAAWHGPANANLFRFAFQGEIISLDPDTQNESFTNTFLNNIYEALVRYDGDGKIEPALATSWKVVEPTVWRFEIRKGVTFHGGEPLTADDIVFSIERALSDTSDQRGVIADVKEARKVDAFTVEIVTKRPAPILIRQLTYILMMSKTWSEGNNAAKPADIRKGETNFAGFNANGTGPFMLKSRRPDVRTELVVNPKWWDKAVHNLTQVHFIPIKSDPTRVAALLTNEVDLSWPVPLQDIPRVNRTDGLKVLEGPEERTLFLGMDQHRDELLYSSVKGRNPFKDIRVRRAIYQAIDIEAIKSRIMRGTSVPTGVMVAPTLQGFVPALNDRLPFDPEASKRLLAEAGYADGFGVSLDCPNDRYINDESICQAITGMLARVGVRVTLVAQSKSIYFGKLLKLDTSFYLLGWASTSTRDALDSYAKLTTCRGSAFGPAYNIGGYCNRALDDLLSKATVEIDLDKRQTLLTEAMKLHKEEIGHIPLHQQAQSWGVRTVFDVPQTPEGSLRLWLVRRRG
ncbi:MAG: ABC transporter substrate-binding protein [Alphaproteobacteria bacterium]|nr:ABC transporter substrate-binding protein [Alphaproteobacteria bacterium]